MTSCDREFIVNVLRLLPQNLRGSCKCWYREAIPCHDDLLINTCQALGLGLHSTIVILDRCKTPTRERHHIQATQGCWVRGKQTLTLSSIRGWGLQDLYACSSALHWPRYCITSCSVFPNLAAVSAMLWRSMGTFFCKNSPCGSLIRERSQLPSGFT